MPMPHHRGIIVGKKCHIGFLKANLVTKGFVSAVKQTGKLMVITMFSELSKKSSGSGVSYTGTAEQDITQPA